MILHAICYLTKSLQCFVEHIINLIVAKLSLEVADGGVFVDVDIFNAYHLGKIFPVLCRHIIGEGAVVGATASVYKDVEPWTVVGGNPAKVLKMRKIIRG